MFLLFVRERREEKDKYQCERGALIRLLLYVFVGGDRTRNLHLCPAQESDPQPFGAQDMALTNGAPRPALARILCMYLLVLFSQERFQTSVIPFAFKMDDLNSCWKVNIQGL